LIETKKKTLPKEPLLHFLLLGAALFVAYGLMSKPGTAVRQRRLSCLRGR